MELDKILYKWDKAKKQKSICEKDCEKYKDAVERYMNKKDTNNISSKNYTVSRRSTTRQTLSQKTCPPDIWNKYSNRISYMTYHIKEK